MMIMNAKPKDGKFTCLVYICPLNLDLAELICNQWERWVNDVLHANFLMCQFQERRQ